MSMSTINPLEDPRAGAEIVHGADECTKHSQHLLQELGFPKGVLPMKDLEECGMNRETGFVWMKSKAPYEHFFREANTRVKYDKEVTAYVEKGKMKKVTGVRSKQLLIWVTLVEMTIEELVRDKIYFLQWGWGGLCLSLLSWMKRKRRSSRKENETPGF